MHVIYHHWSAWLAAYGVAPMHYIEECAATFGV